MATEKRMIENYEVISSVHIGDKEIVLAIDENNTYGEKYMTCFAERNELFERYTEGQVSDDYAEIVKIFGSRISNSAELHLESVKKLGIGQIITMNQSTNGIKLLLHFCLFLWLISLSVFIPLLMTRTEF